MGKIYKSAMEKLRKGVDSAGTTALPDNFCKHIHDLGDGTSFFSAALIESSLRRMFRNKDLFPGGPGSPLVVGIAEEKLKEFHAINLNLMLAMFIGGGMPSRGTEFTSIAIAPHSMVPRHIFLESSPKGPRICTRITYNKARVCVSLRRVPTALILPALPCL